MAISVWPTRCVTVPCWLSGMRCAVARAGATTSTRTVTDAPTRIGGRLPLRAWAHSHHDDAVARHERRELVPESAEVGVGPEVAHQRRPGRQPEPPPRRGDRVRRDGAVEEHYRPGPVA